jgi:hypothetical protein
MLLCARNALPTTAAELLLATDMAAAAFINACTASSAAAINATNNCHQGHLARSSVPR